MSNIITTKKNINLFNLTDSAAYKIKRLIKEEGNPTLKLRVYIVGGGCSGFQYGFVFDDTEKRRRYYYRK